MAKQEKTTQKIPLRLAGKAYGLEIAPEKEEIYRMAEREVNASVNKWQKAFGDNFSVQDCLAIAALQLCINNISIARQSELSDEDTQALDALSQRLDKHLNRMPRTSAKSKK
ncbi:MAG: cell division protein ZapA [Alistipes sp.]|nr:cell division protein ZapA [Alistipes sp.]